MAVKGLTNTGPQSIAVNISTSDGPSAAEREAERTQKERIAQQNALPSWMSNSTVTGDSFSGAIGDSTRTLNRNNDDQDHSKGKPVDTTASARIDDIFERLKAERAAEMAKLMPDGNDEEFGSEEEDGEEAEFEDVPATSHSPSSDTPSTKTMKRENADEFFDRRQQTEGRATKRVRVETNIGGDAHIGDYQGSEEDEEDVEFEDI